MQVLPHHVREAETESRLVSQLRRYPRPLRKRVRKAAMAHAALADLAFTFPMALFAIASAARGREATARARALVLNGAPLRALAHELDLALWLRRLPPEALAKHVPMLPTDAGFTRQIVNYMPGEAKNIGRWLAIMDVSVHAHSRAFALWIAKHMRGVECPTSPDGVALLAAFAWHSDRPTSDAGRWISKPWRAALSLQGAASAASEWINVLQFACHKPAALVAACPPRDNTVGVYHFHRLEWGDDIVAEGQRMNNCLGTYVSDLLAGNQVWSIRCGSRTIADLEIEFQDGSFAMPRLVQLLGASNDPAPDAVWQAAYSWLACWTLCSAPVEVKDQPCVIDRDRWNRTWQPYWHAKGRGRVFPVDSSALDGTWLSNRSSLLWELTRLSRAG
ncbi:MAG: hypothetical protein K0U34_02235 [Alphaproteobacteria bacterium]|nr:hypothetical protein [Alphaproteobacteria bacterium]